MVALAARLALPTGPGAFRLWLAMLVFVHHLSSLGLGAYAVNVFFVLSGVWIERMWEGRYRYARAPYLTYLVSRVWRLAPAMVLASVVTVPLLHLLGVPWTRLLAAPSHLAASSVLLLGYAWLPFAPVGAAWSLDVEMQFYVVAPLLALLARQRAGAVLLVALGLIATVATWWLALPPTLPRYLLFFTIGMAAPRLAWRPSGRWAMASAGAFALVVVLFWATPLKPVLIGGAHPLPAFAYNDLLNAALALLSVPFAVWTTAQPTDGDDAMMADLSYLIYLFHWAAMQWFFTIHGRFVDRLAVAATSLIVVPVAAWVAWRWFDRPINRARGRWVAARLVRDAPDRPVA